MSFKPPNRRVSPLMMATKTATTATTTTMPHANGNKQKYNSSFHSLDQFVDDDSSSYLFRVPSMDSSVAFSEGGQPWICPQCSYSNIDSQNSTCALCGRRDEQHSKEIRRQNRKSSWLSLGSSTSSSGFGSILSHASTTKYGENNSQMGSAVMEPLQEQEIEPQEERLEQRPTSQKLNSQTNSTSVGINQNDIGNEKEDSDSEKMPSPTKQKRKPQTSTGLLPKKTLTRPDRESSEGDSQPGISLPERTYSSPQGHFRPIIPQSLLDSPASSFRSVDSEFSHRNHGNPSIDNHVLSLPNYAGHHHHLPAPRGSPTPQEVTGHSRDSTIRTSNRQTKAPKVNDSPPPTPPMSNRSLRSNRSLLGDRAQNSSRSLMSSSSQANEGPVMPASPEYSERSVSAPPFGSSTTEKVLLPPLRQYHSETSSNRSTESSLSYKQSFPNEDLEQASYLPSTMRSPAPVSTLASPPRGPPHKVGRKSPLSVANSSSTQPEILMPPKRKGSAPKKSPSPRSPKSDKKKYHNASAHTTNTHPTSFTSTSFDDDLSVEATLKAGGQVERRIPLEVAAGSEDGHDNMESGHEFSKKQVRLVCLLGTAIVLVAVIVAVLVAILAGNKNQTSLPIAQAPPPPVDNTTKEPTMSPTVPTAPVLPPTSPVDGGNGGDGGSGGGHVLSLISTERGGNFERLGFAVAVGGPGSRWVVMGGYDFVRVVQFFPIDSENRAGNFLQDRDDLTPVSEGLVLSQVSVSNEQRVAVAWGGELTVYEPIPPRSGSPGDRSGWNSTRLRIYGQAADVFTAISGDGSTVAGVAYRRNQLYTEIEIFYHSEDDDTWKPSKKFSLNEEANSGMKIQMRFSTDGNCLIVLAGGDFYIYKRGIDHEWEKMDISKSAMTMRTEDIPFKAVAISGSGQVFAVADENQTWVFEYSSKSLLWELQKNQNSPIEGGESIALDYSGTVLAVGMLGRVGVWQKTTPESGHMLVGEFEEDPITLFGKSVALSTDSNDMFGLLAVGASSETESSGLQNEGSVHIFQVGSKYK